MMRVGDRNHDSAQAARDWDIADVWLRLGLPEASHGGKVCSPFREDTKPGCQLGGDKNIFFDYATGESLDTIALVRRIKGCNFKEAVAFILKRSPGAGMTEAQPIGRKVAKAAKPRIVATYDYCDLSGALLYQVVRLDPKDFRQRRPDGRGGWDWSLKGVERIPYRLPELVAAVKAGRTIYVCEGEKDVLRLEALGLTATCNAGGAGKWDASFGKWLRGVDVVVLADNDEPGRKHAQDVARKLACEAASIKILPLPDLSPKGDVSDWLDAGGTREQLEKLVADAPEWSEAVEIQKPVVQSEWTGPRPLTDLGAAERFRDQHQGQVLFDVRNGAWRVWDGRRWVLDMSGAIMRLAHQTARSIYDEAKAASDADRAQALAKFAARCENRDRLIAMVEVAKDLEGMTARPDQWDGDPYALNVENGTVDLRTGKLRPHRREDNITRLAPVKYDPDAKHATLDRVLADALPDAETRAFFQRLVGCSLIGEQLDDVFVFVYGPAGSGKTSITEPLRRHLGSYAATLDPGALMAKSFNNSGAASPELARLAGVRYVVSSELQDGAKLDAGLIKRASGGEAIIARQLYAQPFEFVPAFTLWMVSNHFPIVDASDGAIWRRLKVLPFLHAITPERRDPAVKKSMMTECGPALLAWAVRGALDYQQNGLGVEPEAIRRATAEYRESQDPLADFLSDCLVIGDGLSISAKELRGVYERWTQENGVKHPLSPRTLADRLRARGCEQFKGAGGVRMWRGIAIENQNSGVSGASGANFKTFLREGFLEKVSNIAPLAPPAPQSASNVMENNSAQPFEDGDGLDDAEVI